MPAPFSTPSAALRRRVSFRDVTFPPPPYRRRMPTRVTPTFGSLKGSPFLPATYTPTPDGSPGDSPLRAAYCARLSSGTYFSAARAASSLPSSASPSFSAASIRLSAPTLRRTVALLDDERARAQRVLLPHTECRHLHHAPHGAPLPLAAPPQPHQLQPPQQARQLQRQATVALPTIKMSPQGYQAREEEAMTRRTGRAARFLPHGGSLHESRGLPELQLQRFSFDHRLRAGAVHLDYLATKDSGGDRGSGSGGGIGAVARAGLVVWLCLVKVRFGKGDEKTRATYGQRQHGSRASPVRRIINNIHSSTCRSPAGATTTYRCVVRRRAALLFHGCGSRTVLGASARSAGSSSSKHTR